VHDFQTRESLLRYYLDINRGGVIHSDEEMARVEELLAAARTPASADTSQAS